MSATRHDTALAPPPVIMRPVGFTSTEPAGGGGRKNHRLRPLLLAGAVAGMVSACGPGAGSGPGSGSAEGEAGRTGLASGPEGAERRQLGGVRTAIAESSQAERPLILPGVVAIDETRLWPVQLRVSGWVRHLHVSGPGEQVNAGDPLLTLWSPELLQAEREFLIELAATGPTNPEAHVPAPGHGAQDRLRWMGVLEDEIRRLRLDRVARGEITARAPAAGVIVARGITVGQPAPSGATLVTLADLSRVWVLADLPGTGMERVRAGAPATFLSDGSSGRERSGRIEFIYPTVSSATRTARVRMSLDNGDGALMPGMYGRVRLAGPAGRALTVPREAILNSGEHTYVFLPRGNGRFEPRRVHVGPHDGDRVRVLKGLAAGDTVVASAAFLIDSESRLGSAIAGMTIDGSER